MEFKRECKCCKKEFVAIRRDSYFCSESCSKKWKYYNNPKTYTRECQNCGKTHETTFRKAKYCSKSCMLEMRTKKAKKRDVKKTCPVCSNTWVVSYHERNKTEYCSYSCATSAKWKKWEEEGIKEEICNKISETRIKGYNSGRIKKTFGAEAPYWKGGTTSINHGVRGMEKYKAWRQAVYVRDNFTCCSCGATKVYLNADHIKPLHLIIKENNIQTTEQAEVCSELWNTDNGRTLCVPCHRKTDTYGNPKKEKKTRI
jgi:hypothetical protein